MSTFVVFAPIYTTSVLGYDADARVGVPFGLMALVHVLAYFLSKFDWCSSTVAVRIYNTMALVLCAAAFVGLAILPKRNEEDRFEERSLWLMLLCLAPLGLACAGFQMSIVNYGRYYAREIISHLSIPLGVALSAVPTGVLLLNHHNSLVLWRLTFICVAALCLLAAATFAILGRGEPARWTEDSWNPAVANHEMLNKRLISENDECGVVEMLPLDEYLTSAGKNGFHRSDAYQPVDP
ncbi:Protein T01H3.3 [Aphelenchoides avenae]|nr:Protein T01H3.3 [Aphelenchus avenae]